MRDHELWVEGFVDFDLIERIGGVSPCHPHARTGPAVLVYGLGLRVLGFEAWVLGCAWGSRAVDVMGVGKSFDEKTTGVPRL